MLSINSEGSTPDRYTFSLDSVLPYRICEYQLPTTDTGFVYLIISMKKPTFTYIGQCKQLTKRLSDHNSGNGAFGTSDPSLPPFYIAGFISGFESYERTELERLETRWKNARRDLRDRASVLRVLQLGEKIVVDVNEFNMSCGRRTLLNFTMLVAPS